MKRLNNNNEQAIETAKKLKQDAPILLLPQDIWQYNIFLFLGVRHTVILKLTCKAMNSLINGLTNNALSAIDQPIPSKSPRLSLNPKSSISKMAAREYCNKAMKEIKVDLFKCLNKSEFVTKINNIYHILFSKLNNKQLIDWYIKNLKNENGDNLFNYYIKQSDNNNMNTKALDILDLLLANKLYNLNQKNAEGHDTFDLLSFRPSLIFHLCQLKNKDIDQIFFSDLDSTNTRKTIKFWKNTYLTGEHRYKLLYFDSKSLEKLRKELPFQNDNYFARLVNTQGQTLIGYAVSSNNTEMLKTLLNGGVDVNIAYAFFDIPLLHCAVEKNNSTQEIVFSTKGLNVNLSNSSGYTALHYAASKGNAETVKLLLSFKDININARNENGTTPLHMAVINGNLSTVELLISKGADVSIESNITKEESTKCINNREPQTALGTAKKFLSYHVGIGNKAFAKQYEAIVKCLEKSRWQRMTKNLSKHKPLGR